MADRTRVSDLDFVYISFKEPNKEQNWADLKNKVPWAKRVDGVKGFDSAHKAAAETAETDFFISVDGDNIIDETFLLQTLDWSKTNKKAVHRWRAKNNINGLVYGNGGLVGWDKETCLSMRTHENADTDENQIIDGLEALTTLAMLSSMTPLEKMNFVFTCYDWFVTLYCIRTDNSGCVQG